MSNSLAIGSDHAGFKYKEMLAQWLRDNGYEVQDFGTYSADSVDYPDFVHPLANSITGGQFERGILVCGSANGVCITANKHKGIRAAIAWAPELATLARQHNDANIVCIPERFVSEEAARAIVSQFLNTPFEGGRHQTRVSKIDG
ncbi:MULTISPECIES: ribose 5-phosphate isomerase B [Hymenobacter]|uniref:Ribose 5-phosphate isomerase B n=1 Tax=Hymenobacter jejuensis TaxID=2502781 RepID=A0A5B8A587_9BACT|nr:MULTISPECIES: ribose 5-phosphate isomerase B [Hymenobacter]MBC6991827.1 ribose 5-phosphate isomerase B [Hymenobacter sp. BT491]QDA62504.1 ribose 5-phosphate isomerase B [Hymenobacter jejuensis]